MTNSKWTREFNKVVKMIHYIRKNYKKIISNDKLYFLFTKKYMNEILDRLNDLNLEACINDVGDNKKCEDVIEFYDKLVGFIVNNRESLSNKDKMNLIKNYNSEIEVSPIQVEKFNIDNSVENIKYDYEVICSDVFDQRDSTYCWLVSNSDMLNTILKDNDVINDNISLKYLVFFDKFQRFNLLIEKIILGSVHYKNRFFYNTDIEDVMCGTGTYDSFLHLISKYGIVLESDYSTDNLVFENSKEINKILSRIIYQFYSEIKNEKSSKKRKFLEEKYYNLALKVLTKEYGVPPRSIIYDNTKISPVQFYKGHVKELIENEYIYVTSDDEYEYDEKYISAGFHYGKPMYSINMKHEDIEQMMILSLKSNELITISLNLDYSIQQEYTKIIDYEKIYNKEFGLNLDLNKSDILNLNDYIGGHSIIVCGVKLEKGKPVSWKLKNSYGSDYGVNGYLDLSNDYLKKYLKKIVINKKYVKGYNKDKVKKYRK